MNKGLTVETNRSDLGLNADEIYLNKSWEAQITHGGAFIFKVKSKIHKGRKGKTNG